MIIGGGAVGVEMAGEIAEKYSAKTITILHSNNVLVSNNFTDTFQAKLKDSITSMKIELKLGMHHACNPVDDMA